MPFQIWTRVGQGTMYQMWVWTAPSKGTIFREGNARAYLTTLCRELCKNGLTDRDDVWVVDSGEPKEACVIWDTHWRHLNLNLNDVD